MSQINYDKIKDRYDNALKKPVNKPTLEQSIFAWAVINELWELGYCHDFQCADSWVRDYIYDVSAIIDKANEIIEKDEQEETMRCDLCPLWPEGFDDTCPEMDGEYGIMHADGVAGCRHPWNWVKKREREYDRYLGMMADSIVKWMKEQESRRTEYVGNTDRLEGNND